MINTKTTIKIIIIIISIFEIVIFNDLTKVFVLFYAIFDLIKDFK